MFRVQAGCRVEGFGFWFSGVQVSKVFGCCGVWGEGSGFRVQVFRVYGRGVRGQDEKEENGEAEKRRKRVNTVCSISTNSTSATGLACVGLA